MPTKHLTFFLMPALLLVFIGCGASDDSSDGGENAVDDQSVVIDDNYLPAAYSGWYRPDTNTTWQWQLSGTVNTAYDVDLYDIDLFDSSPELVSQLHSSGKKVICYFSAGSYENWRDDAGDFLSTDLGNNLDDWAGEKWLDIRSDNVRSIMRERLDLAAQKGCDGVEPDNMDGYTNNPGFDLTATDQSAYNRFIANEAHDRNLSVGLKNDLDQLGALVEYYDFAVNEQCYQYDECGVYSVFTDQNKAVFNAEYPEEDPSLYNAQSIEALCAEADGDAIRTLILPLDLDDSSRISCQ